MILILLLKHLVCLKKIKKKYALINILINKDMEMAQNAINMKNLLNINNLVNLLLNIYSFKISREDAKKKYLKMN